MPESLISVDDELPIQDTNLGDEADEGAEGGQPASEAAKPSYDPDRLEQELKEIREQVREAERRAQAAARESREAKESADYWRRQATESARKPAKEAIAPEKFFEELETKGPEALRGHYVTPDEVERVVEQRLAQAQIVRRERDLYEKYPDLKDENSEFSRLVVDRVNTRYRRLAGDDPAKLLEAMDSAAEDIKQEMEKNNQNRSTRASFASTGRSSSTASTPSGGDRSPVLDATQREVARRYGVSEKAYLESLKQVQGARRGR